LLVGCATNLRALTHHLLVPSCPFFFTRQQQQPFTTHTTTPKQNAKGQGLRRGGFQHRTAGH
jgi:hypothetical protein